MQTAIAAFGRLDVVMNNAGYGDIAPFEQLSAERFKAVMDTNFYGVVNVTRAAVPLMREQWSGCILQISSVGGRLTRPGSTLLTSGLDAGRSRMRFNLFARRLTKMASVRRLITSKD